VILAFETEPGRTNTDMNVAHSAQKKSDASRLAQFGSVILTFVLFIGFI